MNDLTETCDGMPSVRSHAEIIEAQLRSAMIDAWCAAPKRKGGTLDVTMLTIRMATDIRDLVANFDDTKETRAAITDMITTSRAGKDVGAQRMLCDELVHLMVYLPKTPSGEKWVKDSKPMIAAGTPGRNRIWKKSRRCSAHVICHGRSGN